MANKKYDTVIKQLRGKKNDIIRYVQSFVSQENIEESVIETGEYVRKNLFTQVEVPVIVDSKIGYSRIPAKRKLFNNYVTDVVERIKDIEGHDTSLAIGETIECIIEDLQNEE